MSVKLRLAKAASSVLTWGLRHIAKRPAANTPGLVALRIAPDLISSLRSRMHKGSIVVVGTNGKTTVTNLLANALEEQGFSVLCNRTGANLNSGIASALLQNKGADWGVLECDELWSAIVVPQLKPTYFLLLNLFRDQLDRCGEIDHIQDAIVSGLVHSPRTTLIYNADDPLCEMVAQRVIEQREKSINLGEAAHADDSSDSVLEVSTSVIPFGTLESMGLEQNLVADATMCQRCLHMFDYEYRQYGQLGAYKCSDCGFTRPQLKFGAVNIHLVPGNLEFDVVGRVIEDSQIGSENGSTENSNGNSVENFDSVFHAQTKLNGTYMVYNMLAISSAALTIGCTKEAIGKAISSFNPKNGRLQEYYIRGRKTLLNLAKNPTGFNQNLRIVNSDNSPKAVAFFINDKVVDGHDISWIWDIDFEELVRQPDTLVFAGGIRRNDLQVRLKYAGVKARLIDGIEDVFEAIALASSVPNDASVYAIANYTALPPVHAALNKMQENEGVHNKELHTKEIRNKELAKGQTQSTNEETTSEHTASTDIANGEATSEKTTCCEPGEVAVGARKANETLETSSELEVPSLSEASGVLETFDVSEASGISETPDASEVSKTLKTLEILETSNIPGASGESKAVRPVVIAHILPDLLNLYGDGGNVRILQKRLEWRDIPVEVCRYSFDDAINFDDVDLVVLGGSPDREQRLALEHLKPMATNLKSYVESGAPLLAICGGYQMLGRVWVLDGEEVAGLDILPMDTKRTGSSTDRMIDNIALLSKFASHPVIGYENHSGRTYLDEEICSFGAVVSSTGHGNNDQCEHSKCEDGIIYKGVIGTYLHGPLLSKNPEIADRLLQEACNHAAKRYGEKPIALEPLNDSEELAANQYMASRVGVSRTVTPGASK